jgi:hypothetical protein
MFEPTNSRPESPDTNPYLKLIRRLGETFVVRDVMVQLPQIQYVTPGDEAWATRIFKEKRYSVVTVSADGRTFNSVFCTTHEAEDSRRITGERPTSISDHIPDSTPLADAFFLFDSREWYLTLRDNRVSGLITYWAFNSREFRVQIYAGLSRVEELSRDVLVKDGCGLMDERGLTLTPTGLAKIRERIGPSWLENGGNRFVDELDYHQVNHSLSKHAQWRSFLSAHTGQNFSNTRYDRDYNFTALRDAVMHGRVLFQTYREFKESVPRIRNIGKLIDLLGDFLSRD